MGVDESWRSNSHQKLKQFKVDENEWELMRVGAQTLIKS
jgi:hypothetical protein